MSIERIKLLQNMPIFGGISEEVLEFFLQSPAVKRNKGEHFFHAGEPGNSLFVLEYGSAVAVREVNDCEYVLSMLEKGDSFGEMAFIDLFPRSASVYASEKACAIEISTEKLYEVYTRNIEQFVIIQMNVGREISRRLRATDDRLFKTMLEGKIKPGKLESGYSY